MPIAMRPAPGPLALRMRQRAHWPLRLPPQSRPLIISGVTRDASGAVLGGCLVRLFATATDVLKETQVSDPVTGVYQFSSIVDASAYYAVAYLHGSPDVAGTTVNTLAGA